MWYLSYSNYIDRAEHPTTKAILPGKQYTIGKKDTNIIIQHDNSISKKHITITVGSYSISNLEDDNFKPNINIVAHKTTYGTRLNGEVLEGSSHAHQDSTIHLGSLGFCVRLRWKSVVVCRNAAKSSEKKKLAKAAIRIGFSVLKKWNKRCTHLYMTDLIVSDRLIYSLVNNKPIVSDKWLDKMIEQGDVDEANKVIEPIILEDYGPLKKRVELSYNLNRKELFEGIEFWIFSQEQYNRLKFLIELCQGGIKMLDLNEDVNMTDIKETTLFIQPPPEMVSSNRWVALETQFCSSHGFVRTINEQEIVYSVIYCSTNTLCNPKVAYPTENEKKLDTEKTEESYASTETFPSKSSHPSSCSRSQTTSFSSKAIDQSSCSNFEADTINSNRSKSFLSNAEADTVPYSSSKSFLANAEADTLPYSISDTMHPDSRTLQSNPLEYDESELRTTDPADSHVKKSKDNTSITSGVNEFFDDFFGVLDAPSSPPQNIVNAQESSLNKNMREVSPPSKDIDMQDLPVPTVDDDVSMRSHEPSFHDLFDMGSPIASHEHVSKSRLEAVSEPIPEAMSEPTIEVMPERENLPENAEVRGSSSRHSFQEEYIPSDQVVYMPLVKRPRIVNTEMLTSSNGINFKRFRKVQQFQNYNHADITHTFHQMNQRHSRSQDVERIQSFRK